MFFNTSRHKDIQILRIGANSVNTTLLAPERSDDDFHFGPIVIAHKGDIFALDVLISRRGHFQRCG